jgi:hypothetical protein
VPVTKDKRKLRRLWPDVPRLLRAREQFSSYQTPDAGISVPAFLAWKAFLIVMRCEEGETEKERCRNSVTLSLRAFRDDLHGESSAFIHALHHFLDETPAVVSDWYLPTNVDGHPEREVRRIVQDLKRLEAHSRRMSAEQLAELGPEIADQLYQVRCSVIAHASVLTNGNLFDVIVPAFGRLVAALSLAGWARRAGISLQEAKELNNVSW